MKRIILVLLVLLLALCGCGKEQNPDVETRTPATTLEETAATSPFDFVGVHYSLQLPVYEIVQGDGIWGSVEYGDFVYDENGLLIKKTKLTINNTKITLPQVTQITLHHNPQTLTLKITNNNKEQTKINLKEEKTYNFNIKTSKKRKNKKKGVKK